MSVILPQTFERFSGDSSTLTIKLAHPDTGAAYSAVGAALIFTLKRVAQHADADAVVQKSAAAGNLVASGTNALAKFYPDDFEDITPEIAYEFAVKVQDPTAGPLTVARGTITFDVNVAQALELSVETHTTNPDAPYTWDGIAQRPAAITAFEDLVPAADTLAYFTSPTAAALTAFSALARTLAGHTTNAQVRSTLSVYSIAEIDNALALKANLVSPTFTGVPLAPTAAVDTNTTQIATTAFVVGQGYLKSATAATTYQPLDADLTAIAALSTAAFGRGLLTEASAITARASLSVYSIAETDNALALKANVASPTFTGTPAAPTAAADTNTTQLATTAYVIGQGYLKSATAATTYQPLDADLTAIAALSTAAFGRGLLTEASAITARATLSVLSSAEIAAAYQPLDGDLTAIAALSTAAFGRGLLTETSAITARATLSVPSIAEVAAGYQPLDGDLTAIAALSTTAFGRGLLTSATGVLADINSITSAAATNLTLTGNGGASLTLGQGAASTGATLAGGSGGSLLALRVTADDGRLGGVRLQNSGGTSIAAFTVNTLTGETLLGSSNSAYPLTIMSASVSALSFTGSTLGAGVARINYTTAATGTTSGAFQCAGGGSFSKPIFVATSSNAYGGAALNLFGQDAGTTCLTRAGGTFFVSNDGSTDHFKVTNAGDGTFSGTITASGTGASSFSGPVSVTVGGRTATIGGSSFGNVFYTTGAAPAWAFGGGVAGMNWYDGAAATIMSLTSGGSLSVSGDLTVSGGNVGIGEPTSADRMLSVNSTNAPLTGTTQYAAVFNPTFGSGATALIYGLYVSGTKTVAAPFAVVEGNSIFVTSPALGAGSSLATQIALKIANQGATNIQNAIGVDIAAQSGASTTNIGLRNAGTTILSGAIALNTSTFASGRYISLGGTWAPAIAATATALEINTAITPNPSQIGAGLVINPSFTEAASGTHTVLAGTYMVGPVITGGAATTTLGATLYIAGATTGAASSNYALYVADGVVSVASAITGTSTTSAALLASSAGFTGNVFVGGYASFAANTPNPTGDGQGYAGATSAQGFILQGRGSANDFNFYNKNGSTVLSNPTGTQNLVAAGSVSVAGGITTNSSATWGSQAGTANIGNNLTHSGTWNHIATGVGSLLSLNDGGNGLAYYTAVSAAGGAVSTLVKQFSISGGNVRITGNLGVGNSAAATTPGSVTKKIEVFDAAGASLGFLPVYASIA